MLHVHFQVLPHKREIFKELIEDIVKHSRKETGNICFDLYQSKENENDYVLIEKWQNQDALDRHERFPYFRKFVDKIPEVLEKRQEVEVYKL